MREPISPANLEAIAKSKSANQIFDEEDENEEEEK